MKETFERAMAFLDAGIAEREREREAERAAAEAALAAERERLEHQAQVQHMRAEAAQRLTRRTRLAALAWAWIAVIAIALGVYGWLSAHRAEVEANAARVAEKAAADAKVVAQGQTQVAEIQREKAAAASAAATKAEKVALAQRAEALKQRAETERQKRAADQERGVAQSQTAVAVRERGEAVREGAAAAAQETIAKTQTHVAEKQRSAVFMQSGREALLSGDDDNAAVLLAAAYTQDPHNPALAMILRQALLKLRIRDGAFVAQDGAISAIAFNPASPHEFATASGDGSAKLWNTGGQSLHTFDDQNEVITALAFDPSGKHLVTAGADGSAKIRDLTGITPAAAKPPLGLRGHTRRINSVAFSHDGTRVLTAGSDGKIRVWLTATGQLVGDFDQGQVAINDARYTPDDGRIVAGASDGTLRVLDARTGKVVQTETVAQNSAVLHVAVSPDGRHAAAGASDGSVLLYDLAASKQIALRRDDHGTINAVSFDGNGTHLLTASDSGTARLIDVASGASTPLIPAAGTGSGIAAVQAAQFSPAGNAIATTYSDGMVRLWANDGTAIAGFQGHRGTVVAAAFDPSGDILATGGNDGRVALWRPPSAVVPADASQAGAIDAIRLDRDGKRLLTASHDGTAALWSVGTKLARIATLPHSPGGAWVTAANFNADGSRIVTAGGTAVKVWSAKGALLETIAPSAPSKRFTDALFVGNRLLVSERTYAQGSQSVKDHWRLLSADGKTTLVTEPGWDNGIRSLQVAGAHVLALTALGWASYDEVSGKAKPVYWEYVTSGSLSNAHAFYALGWANGEVSLVNGDKLTYTFNGGRGWVTAVGFSADDAWLASAGADDLYGKVWDVANQRLHATLKGHQGEITSIAFSPGSGAFILTTSADGTAKLWDRDSGGQLASASVPGSKVATARFTPDGHSVVLGAADGAVYLWRVGGTTPPAGVTARAVLAEGTHSSNSTDLLLTQALQTLKIASKGGR
ncbi:MAG TPA: WD40 repeat domain-containing protein [Candidatus Elarobacter sp.]|nr:WD40 repeat domain-containing protein [Candidatus Elarobacter sp.]